MRLINTLKDKFIVSNLDYKFKEIKSLYKEQLKAKFKFGLFKFKSNLILFKFKSKNQINTDKNMSVKTAKI